MLIANNGVRSDGTDIFTRFIADQEHFIPELSLKPDIPITEENLDEISDRGSRVPAPSFRMLTTS